jgi:hypothetical protein
MSKYFKMLLPAILILVILLSCKKNNSATVVTENADLSIYKRIYGATSVTQDGNFVVIKSSDLPDHKSPYYQGTQWPTLYEAYNGTGQFVKNPSSITSQNLTFRIPLYPKESASKPATPMGPIGISLNGVPFFNQYAAGGSPLTNEIISFDQYGGHPQQQGQYHYHAEPFYLTATKGKAVLLGFLLDGFPVYGPMENNSVITNAQLDAYHGHTAATPDYPAGIYHYHITSSDPYINGNGFYGTPGTVSN